MPKISKSKNIPIADFWYVFLLGLLRRFLEPDPDSVIVLLCMSYFNRVLHHSGELVLERKHCAKVTKYWNILHFHLNRSRRPFRVRSSDWYHMKALSLNFQNIQPLSLCRKCRARYFRKTINFATWKKVDHCHPESPRVRYANYRLGTGSELDSCHRSLLGTANGVVTTNHILSRSSNYRDFSNDPLFFQFLKPDWSYEKTRQGSFIGSKRYLVRMRCPIFSSIGPVDHSPAIAGLTLFASFESGSSPEPGTLVSNFIPSIIIFIFEGNDFSPGCPPYCTSVECTNFFWDSRIYISSKCDILNFIQHIRSNSTSQSCVLERNFITLSKI